MRIWQYKVYLARHLGIPPDILGGMPGQNFMRLVAETEYQRRSEQYVILYLLANIMTILTNTKTSKKNPEQIVGREPTRGVTKSMTTKETYEVVLGDGETYTMGVLNVNMMEAVEEEFDKTWTELFDNPRVRVVKSMILQMLLPDYPNMTKDRVGELVTAKNLPALVAIITGMTNG